MIAMPKISMNRAAFSQRVVRATSQNRQLKINPTLNERWEKLQIALTATAAARGRTSNVERRTLKDRQHRAAALNGPTAEGLQTRATSRFSSTGARLAVTGA